MVAYVDGEWMDSADARISVFDHGLLYGCLLYTSDAADE